VDANKMMHVSYHGVCGKLRFSKSAFSTSQTPETLYAMKGIFGKND